MAITTIGSHIYAALHLHDKRESTYLVIGRTSAWTDERNPPNEDGNASAIQEVVGYKKVKQFSLCRPLKSGETAANAPFPTVSYGSTTWVLVPRDRATAEGARWLYFEAELLPSDLPQGNYRQVGIHMDLKPNNGVTKPNLRPNEVQDRGRLHFFENREAMNRTSSVTVIEQFIART